MGFVSQLRGLGSGANYAPDTVMNLCLEDNRPVEIVLDLKRIKEEQGNFAWYHPEIKNMWRFGSLLPLDIADPKDRPNIVSLGEGHTPLLDYSDNATASKVGFRLSIKEEGMPVPGFGANPTQSFKDRGMSMAVSMAKKLGLTKLAVPTQGNAGDALAEYGVHAGFEVVVVMPEDTPMPILGKVAAYSRLYPNVQLDLVQGTIKEAGALVKEKYVPQGYFSVATFQEPGWRIEGKKTMGLELAEPEREGEPWKLPDVIIYPTGGGTGVLGMWKAFSDLEAMGVIGSKRPRFVCVQSENTPPVVNAFLRGEEDTTLATPGSTIATGLNVPGGVGHFKVLSIIRESGGCAVGISENSIAETLRETYRKKGWWISPEGAAAIAAIDSLAESKMIRPGDHVVVFNTGSFEKYLPNLRNLLIGVRPEVIPTI